MDPTFAHQVADDAAASQACTKKWTAPRSAQFVPRYINHIHKAFRAEFVTSLLIAVFVFAMAHAAISEPAPAYNCGDRGVRYCIVEYSYPECGDSEPARDSRAIMASQSLWRASLWGLWTSNRVEFQPNVIIE